MAAGSDFILSNKAGETFWMKGQVAMQTPQPLPTLRQAVMQAVSMRGERGVKEGSVGQAKCGGGWGEGS